ncbi:ABC transporter [Achromatium sp. WMS2]|nr:ABC transporter [Achromatium sp. WMS2]
MNEPLLALDKLVVGYQEPVIGPISLNLYIGEIVGIWGANGCGKSTLLKAIANTAKIFSGHIHKKPGLTTSWQFQRPIRLPAMPFSGQEYLRYANADCKTPPATIKPWLKRRVDTLSGGQFQLLAVWACLGSWADLILLDEPTNNLDPNSETLLVELLNANPEQRGILLVSHEHTFLHKACTRVVDVGQ